MRLAGRRTVLYTSELAGSVGSLLGENSARIRSVSEGSKTGGSVTAGLGPPITTDIAQAVTLLDQGAAVQALHILDAALAAGADHATIQALRGMAFYKLAQYADAAACFAAVASRNALMELYLATSLYRSGRGAEAGPHYKAAIAQDPALEDAYAGLALLFRELKNFPASVACLDQGRKIIGTSSRLEGLGVYLRLALADWSHFAEDCRRVRAAVDRADGRLDPAIVCLLPDFSAADQKRVAEAYARRLMAEAHVLSEPMPAKARQKLRLGYVSNDFADHPVGRHMVGILAHHDRSRFHVRGYALGRDDGSAISRRLRESFDELVDLSTASDRAAAERIRADEIDILIDLGGFTEGSRPGIAVLRAAPIQALYLGISGTCGAPIFDYVITDRVVTPPELADRYGEKFAFLPGSLFNSDHTETGPLPSTNRQDHGLPPDGFVFCAFNNTAKITPQIFDVWMDLLHAVSDGVLWLRKYYAGSSANLRKAAEARGIAAERLIFAGVVPRPEHLGRMACADLGLDTFPYGAGSTASDMLWAGVPLLTCAGETYASRMAASQLHAVDLAELVATDIEDYRAKALSWATNRAQLRALRQRLAEARATSMLFDAARFTRALEQLYTELVGASPEVS